MKREVLTYLLMTSCQIVLHLEVFSFKTFINLFRLYNTLHTCLLTNLNKFFTFLDWSEVSTIIFLSMLKPCFHFTFKFCWDCFRVFSVLLWFYLVINRKLSTFGLLFALFAGSTDTYVRKYHKKIYNIYPVNMLYSFFSVVRN